MSVAGDRRFAALYDNYYTNIYAYCRRRTSSERVEDAVAETFLVAWRRLDDVPEGESALLWLYGVAFRVVSNQWRARNRKKRLDQKLEAVGTTVQHATDHYVVVRDDVRRVIEAAGSLGETDLETLRLAFWEELDNREIASVLDISQGAVKQRLHRARRNLVREYERLGSEPEPDKAREGRAW